MNYAEQLFKQFEENKECNSENCKGILDSSLQIGY